VLVSGGAGFIGSHLVERLASEQVRRLSVVDNFFLGRESNLEPAFGRCPSLALYRDDATDLHRMTDIMRIERPDVVFHLATIPLPASLERPEFAVGQIIDMTSVLLELGRQGLYGRLVHCSSSEAYGTASWVPMDETHPLDARTPYAGAKAAADLLVKTYCRTFNLSAVIVRPFNAYGPRQNDGCYAGVIPQTIRRILAGEPPAINGDGEQTRDFTYVEDTIEGLVLAGSNDRVTSGDIFNVGSGREVSIRHLVEQIAELLGYRGEIYRGPPRPADVRRHCADIGRARRQLGFEPRVTIGDGLAATVAWYRQHLPEPV
jgi:UDP-glucose 4-epimerase